MPFKQNGSVDEMPFDEVLLIAWHRTCTENAFLSSIHLLTYLKYMYVFSVLIGQADRFY